MRGKYREAEAGGNQNRMATKQVCIGIGIGGSGTTSGESVRVNHWPPLQLPTAVCKCCARWRSSAATTPRPAGRSDRCGSTVSKQNNTYRFELELGYRRANQVYTLSCTLTFEVVGTQFQWRQIKEEPRQVKETQCWVLSKY